MKTLLPAWLGVTMLFLACYQLVLQSYSQSQYNKNTTIYHELNIIQWHGLPLSCIYRSVQVSGKYLEILNKSAMIDLTVWRVVSVTVWHNIFCVTCDRSSVTLTLLRLIITLVIACNDRTAVWSHQITQPDLHLPNWNSSLAATTPTTTTSIIRVSVSTANILGSLSLCCVRDDDNGHYWSFYLLCWQWWLVPGCLVYGVPVLFVRKLYLLCWASQAGTDSPLTLFSPASPPPSPPSSSLPSLPSPSSVLSNWVTTARPGPGQTLPALLYLDLPRETWESTQH